MKVLFLTYSPTPYRVEFFNKLGSLCELTVLYEVKSTTNRDSNWNKNSRAKNFKEIFLKGIRVKENLKICPSILKYLKRNVYDFIIIGGYSTPTGMLAIEYLKLKNIKFILNCDGGMVKNDNFINYYIKRHFISSANWWLSTGDSTNKYLIKYGAKNNHIFEYPFTSVNENDIINNLVPYDEKVKLRKKLGINYDNVIISVGQFIYRKGFDILLTACKDIDNSIGVYIIGGKETDEYLNIIKKLGLKNIHFVGFKTKEQIKDYYKCSDIFVLPTREDIWGLVINEAMANGLPIITTDKCVAGIELINNNENGYIVPVENHIKLADAINKCILNKNLTECMGEKNIEKIKSYTIETMAKRHIEVLNMIKERV